MDSRGIRVAMLVALLALGLVVACAELDGGAPPSHEAVTASPDEGAEPAGAPEAAPEAGCDCGCGRGGAGFVDEDGDGVCDRMGEAGGCGCGRGGEAGGCGCGHHGGAPR